MKSQTCVAPHMNYIRIFRGKTLASVYFKAAWVIPSGLQTSGSEPPLDKEGVGNCRSH